MDEREIFLDAVEIPEHERGEWLDQKVGKDSDLRVRLENLLANHTPDGSFLEDPIVNQFDEAPTKRESDSTRSQQSPLEGAVSSNHDIQIGNFRLLQKIGEGGFGIVYVAEQLAPVRRKVAFKLIRRGMESREIVARFEAERQALAMMDHPYIAQVYDGGTTDSGHPYFVMELVRGIPITKFCERQKLSTRDRLFLASKVCDAIQHAHQKGVIHRDIKPGNVLVVERDGQPVPKVIDFGVSKAIHQPLTDKTIYTQYGHFVGTPHYMSPEQAGLNGQDIDTRSDVFSLGVLLYEILVGETPIPPDRVRKLSVAEIQRIVSEEDPVRPSTNSRLAKFMHGPEEKGDQLRRSIRGELDWIVMKALEKDRVRRYETAAGLSADIRRFLQGEVVLASPPSATYQLRKFLTKNRKVAASVGFAIASLAIGLSLALVGLIQSQRDRGQLKIANEQITEKADAAQRASEEAARLRIIAEERAQEAIASSTQATRLNNALSELIATAHPKADGDSEYTASELLDRYVDWLDGKLLDAPIVKGDILFSLGAAYLQMGDRESAEPCFEQSIQLRREAFGSDTEKVAEALVEYAVAARKVNPSREALRILESKPPGQALVRTLRWLAWGIALGQDGQGKQKEAEQYARQGLEVANSLTESVDGQLLGGLHEALADSLLDQGRFAEAFLHAEKSMGVLQELPEKNIDVAWAATRATIALNGAKQFRKATEYAEKAVGIFEEFAVDVPLANGLSYLALSQASHGDFDQAMENYRRSATLRERADLNVMAILTYGDAGDLADSQGNSDLAVEMFQRALAFEMPSTQPNACYAQMRLQEIKFAQGASIANSEERFRYAQQEIDRSEGRIEAERIRLCRARDNLLKDDVDLALVRELANEVLELTSNSADRFGLHSGGQGLLVICDAIEKRFREAEDGLHRIPHLPTYTHFHQSLVMSKAEAQLLRALEEDSDREGLERLLKWGVQVREQALPPNDAQLAFARIRLAEHLHRNGENEEARALAGSAQEGLAANQLVGETKRKELANLLTELSVD